MISSQKFYTFSSADEWMSSLSFCCSKNANNSESEMVLYELEVATMADVILQGWGFIGFHDKFTII